ncbi:alpha carbonic anhydrase [Entophlyctis helioformis]|nr:alpha carbonic anhydrase [Entophlyctis helioformis]
MHFSLVSAAVLMMPLVQTVAAHPNCLADFIVRPEHAHHLVRRAEGKGADFGYEGALSPAFWAALDPAYTTCAVGKHQSPIDFSDPAMLRNTAHALSWANKAAGLTFTNNGHTIQANFPDNSTAFSLKAAGSSETYFLKQFHLHAPSEHHKEERDFALEIHFVHMTESKKIAVMGVWFELAEKGSPFLDQLLANGTPKEGDKLAIEPLDFAPLKRELTSDKALKWSYSGSLTTPPCSESVAWTVADKPMTISLSQLKTIKAAMPFNARGTAPVGKANTIKPSAFDASAMHSTEGSHAEGEYGFSKKGAAAVAAEARYAAAPAAAPAADVSAPASLEAPVAVEGVYDAKDSVAPVAPAGGSAAPDAVVAQYATEATQPAAYAAADSQPVVSAAVGLTGRGIMTAAISVLMAVVLAL